MARIRIGDLMVRAGLIDEMQLQAALAYQRQWGGRLGDVLVSQGFLDEMMLWRGLSKQLNVPLVSLPELTVTPDVLGLVPLDIAVKLEVFPVARDERSVTVATSEPNNVGAVDELAFRSGLTVKTVLAPAREVEWAIRTYYRGVREPCPPPRLRRSIDLAALPDAATSSARPPQTGSAFAPTATPLGEIGRAGTPAPRTGVTGVTGLTGIPGAAAVGGVTRPPGVVDEQLHRQTVDTLRAVIELCVARGVFTREDLWHMLQGQAGTKR